jgi:hypothetical protein
LTAVGLLVPIFAIGKEEKKKKRMELAKWRGFGFPRESLIIASQKCVFRADFFQDGYFNLSFLEEESEQLDRRDCIPFGYVRSRKRKYGVVHDSYPRKEQWCSSLASKNRGYMNRCRSVIEEEIWCTVSFQT